MQFRQTSHYGGAAVPISKSVHGNSAKGKGGRGKNQFRSA